MRTTCFLTLLFLALTHSLPATESLTFEVNTHPAAVALQFDVTSSDGAVSFGIPEFNGASPHLVESNEISSGVTRYVIYSSTGLPISQEGKILVTFSLSAIPFNGMIQIGNVMASDSAGNQVGANPNALPISIEPPTHLSAELSQLSLLAANVIDPDGSVLGVQFRLNDNPVANASPGQTSAQWAPSSPGLFDLSARVTDSSGGLAFIPLGTYRAYQLGDITSFSSFTDIPYASAANPAWLGFSADPFGNGIQNGLAYLLGINPHRPDRSRILSASTEDIEGEPHVVFRFVRSTSATGVDWVLWETTDLAGWNAVSAPEISESPISDHLSEVTVRRPLSASPEGRLFMQLEASPMP